MQSLFLQLRRESRGHNTGTKKIAVGIEVDAGHELTSSQVNAILFIQANHT
jgi:pyridoxine 5'-phosphate synthase PdxJ